MTQPAHYPPKPFKNCYWLADGILAGEIPIESNLTETYKKLVSLLNAGIRVFINLIGEAGFDYKTELLKIAGEKGIEVEYTNYRIKDMHVPSKQMMREILDQIDNSISNGRSVYYHCWAGLGRTGIVSACYLKRYSDMDGEDVLELLQKIRMEQEHLVHYDRPQSAVQYDFVDKWMLGE